MRIAIPALPAVKVPDFFQCDVASLPFANYITRPGIAQAFLFKSLTETPKQTIVNLKLARKKRFVPKTRSRYFIVRIFK